MGNLVRQKETNAAFVTPLKALLKNILEKNSRLLKFALNIIDANVRVPSEHLCDYRWEQTKNQTKTEEATDGDFVDTIHRRNNNQRFHKINQKYVKSTTFKN